MSFVQNALQDSYLTLQHFMNNQENLTKIEMACETLADAFASGNKAMSCGNGGSFCDAMHFAEELTGRFRKDRRALPAIAMSDGSHMTCVANDFGYDHVFSKYIEAFGQKGDVLLAISTSGNSPNVLKAVEFAKAREMKVIALSGKDGGKLKELADVTLIVESKMTDRIQEIHIKLIHIFIEAIERRLFPEHYA
jgi:D-sedoheptulose 7-phosphate isomerase